MKKKLGNIIAIGSIVFVIVLVFVISSVFSVKYVEEISFEDYNEAFSSSSDDRWVFYGDKTSADDLNDVLKEMKETAYFLNKEDVTSSQASEVGFEDSGLKIYHEGKEYNYSDSFDSYLFDEFLIHNGIVGNKIIEVSIDEYVDLIKDKGTHFMFIGSATCSFCKMYTPEVLQVLSKNSDLRVYYIDISKIVTDEDYEKFINTDSYLTENEWGTPLSLLYKDGKLVDTISGYVTETEVTNFLKENNVI